MSQWTDKRHQRFADDLERMGYEIRDYGGRWGYEGPAVVCSKGELQDVLRATDVRVVWDELGKGLIVYPDDTRRIREAKEAYDFNSVLKQKFGIEWASEADRSGGNPS